MNREMQKTLVFVAAALLLTGAAFLTRPDRSIRPEAFNDQGQKFFDDFDPNLCNTLEVIDYDTATAQVKPFKVTNRDGKWVIPSHYDYPADAKQRLVDTATGVIGLTKDRISSDRVEDHEVFGVLDPLDAKTTSLTGIGKRITLKQDEKVLADFVIGKEVKDHPDQRYVRMPGQKRTYAVNVKVDLSTRFADWIETNLLKLTTSAVRKVIIDHKGVDPAARRIVPGDVITLERKDGSSPWTIDGEIPAGKEANAETLTALTNALGDLKIAGIRPKPDGLMADLLEGKNEFKRMDQQSALSMVAKGFYPTKDGLYSNKGEVTVITDEGVAYSLRYGEVIFATGDEFTAGKGKDPVEKKDEKAEPKDAGKGAEGTSEGRYLLVTTNFDPVLLPPIKGPSTPDDKFPTDPFLGTEAEPSLVKENDAEKVKASKIKEDRDKQVADAQKKAKELSDRFAAWYYVTPGDSYRTIVHDRTNLIREKTARPPTPPGRPGGFPGGMTMPFGPDGP